MDQAGRNPDEDAHPPAGIRPLLESLEGRALMTAGVLDPSFGNGGIVPTPVQGGTPETAVYPQKDPGDPADAGKILIAGNSHFGTTDDFAVTRYNPNGTLDTSFGGTGPVVTSFKSLNDEARSVASQSDGKIVVCGFESTGYPKYKTDFALVRYNTNGWLDTTFGGDGVVVTKLDFVRSVSLGPPCISGPFKPGPGFPTLDVQSRCAGKPGLSGLLPFSRPRRRRGIVQSRAAVG